MRPSNLWIAAAVINAATTLGLEVDRLIPAGTDGVHPRRSTHGLDIRTTHLAPQDRSQLLIAIRQRLGEGYAVVLEAFGQPNERAHIERDA